MRTAVRTVTSLAVLVLTGMMMVPSALAQTEYETPPTVFPTVERAGEVSGASGASGASGGNGEIAFTGFRLTVWMALLVVLVAVGLAAAWAGSRRARAARHA
jgi:hypothetical protein